MKNIVYFFSLILTLQLSQFVVAQSVNPADVETLFNFAEQAEPGLFAPPGAVTQDTEPGWLYRFFTGTGSYAAVHIGSGGQYQQGGVYVLGGPFGDEVTFVDSLPNLITLINNMNPGGGQSGITNPGNGNCVAVGPPAEGTVANYQTVSTQQGGQSVLDFTTEYVAVSNTQITTRQTSEANIGGLQSTSETDSTSNFEVDGDLIYTTSVSTSTTSTIPNFGTSTQGIEISYSPRLFNGPASTYCEMQQWTVGTVSQSTTSTPPIMGQPATVVSDTSPVNATVLSVNESVTVPAGTFNTVKWELGFGGSVTSVNWFDPDTGLNIKVETFDDLDALTSTTELQSIN